MPDRINNVTKLTESEIINSALIDVEETGKYFLDKQNNICREVIHIIQHKGIRTRVCIFKKLNKDDNLDLGVYARTERDMRQIPESIVARMHISANLY